MSGKVLDLSLRWTLARRLPHVCSFSSKTVKDFQIRKWNKKGVVPSSTSLSSPVLNFSVRNGLIFKRDFHSSRATFLPVIPFKLSDIGEGIKEVTIKEWFVQEGDTVSQFDQICEVQSDKASVTITSRYDGTVRKLHYSIDDIALVGTSLVDIEVIEEGGKAGGDEANQQEEIQERDAIQVGRAPEEESFSLPHAGFAAKALATPAVRRMAAEYKIDLKNVQGTGKEGRVLKEDVINYMNNKKEGKGQQDQAAARQKPLSSPASVQPPSPKTSGSSSATPSAPALTITRRSVDTPSDRTETIKGYTKAMIKTMTAANEIPHFGYSDEIEVTTLNSLRKELKDVAAQYNVKLTVLSFFMKAASLALSQFPILNASIDLANNTIIYKGAHNIGIAMDTKAGLIVPNVKNVESKSILEVAEDLQNLHRAAIGGSVKPDDLRGGTFSISNIGSLGATYAHPVILPPEVAIVAIGRIRKLPRFDKDGNVVPTEIINVSFSCDHRVIDGATAARFSNLWKSYIEQPASMLLHLR